MKKIISLFLIGVLTLSIVACGDKNETPSIPDADIQQEAETVVEEEDTSNIETELTESQKFMGFNLYYSANDNMLNNDLGYDLNTTTGICVLIGAPGTAGVKLEPQSLEEAVSMCEEYIFDTLEISKAGYFFTNHTVHNIELKELKTVNGIEMLHVAGSLENTWESEAAKYESVGYYFLAGKNGDAPMYILGFATPDATADVAAVVDEFVSHIEKIN